MAVSVNDIASLNNKNIYTTDNDNIVLRRDSEKIIHNLEYKILGFLNGYMYAASGIYLEKNTLAGENIANIYIEVEHAVFVEGCSYFYAYTGNTLYKITQNLEISWKKTFQREIHHVSMDIRGDIYVVLESGRSVLKLLNTGEEIVYLDSADPAKDVTIHCTLVTKGAGWLYVLSTEYWGITNKAQVFLDKYNTRTWDRVERISIKYDTNIDKTDTSFQYREFDIVNDYIYLYGINALSKINIKGLEFWSLILPNLTTTLRQLEYSDNPKTDYLYFGIDNPNTNGYTFGKLTLGGSILWSVTMTDSEEASDFNFSVYQNKIYTTGRSYIQPKCGYVLSINNDQVLFKTRDGHLVEVVEYNYDSIYSSDNYYKSYLLADIINDGVEDTIYNRLRHDDGDIITENGEVILFPEENSNYTSSDNYSYKKLVCSDYRFNANKFSQINTKTFTPIRTKLGNIIRTKEPIVPDRIHEYITDAKGERLETMDKSNIVRSKFKYAFDRYLLSDINMYFDEIITKAMGHTIVTKASGHDIVMKTRTVYTYTLRSYSDINIVEEWLQENGVLDTNLPKYIEELRHHTVDAINDIQVAGTPVIYDVQEYKQFKYTFNGVNYNNNTWGTQIFSCTNLPYDKRRCQHKIYIDSLANIIKKQEMRPVLFFLNGKAIPWSDCTIVRDWSYSYLIINNTNPYETDLSCIMFPCDIRYGEDNDCLPDEVCDTNLYFNSDGELTQNRDEVSIRVEIIDENIIGETLTYDKGYVEVINNYDQVATDQNIIVFDQGEFFPDSKYYITHYGKDIFSYHKDTTNVTFKTFYWVKANDYKGILYKVPNCSYIKETLLKVLDETNSTSSSSDGTSSSNTISTLAKGAVLFSTSSEPTIMTETHDGIWECIGSMSFELDSGDIVPVYIHQQLDTTSSMETMKKSPATFRVGTVLFSTSDNIDMITESYDGDWDHIGQMSVQREDGYVTTLYAYVETNLERSSSKSTFALGTIIFSMVNDAASLAQTYNGTWERLGLFGLELDDGTQVSIYAFKKTYASAITTKTEQVTATFMVGTILFSTSSDSESFTEAYDGTWECIGAMSVQLGDGTIVPLYMHKETDATPVRTSIKVTTSTAGSSGSAISDFRVPFNFTMKRSKAYSENVAHAVNYIMQYDMSLLVQYYKDQSYIKSYVFDREYLINRVPKDGGWLIMPRSRKNSYDDYIIVFRNNHLYEYYKDIEYDSHNFKIPIFNHVERGDKIEILHFKEVDNSFYSLTVTDSKTDYIPEGLRYDNFLLFGNSPSGDSVYNTFSVENNIQYDIDFSYKNNFNSANRYTGTDIKLGDDYYYYKSINMCSKRQFRFMYYNIFYNRDTINLSPDFRFCHDKTKYMIFKNNLLLIDEDWDLVYMTSENRTNYVSIKFTDTLIEGDCINVLYLPMSYDVIDITNNIDWTLYNSVGDICINMDHLGYQYDKDLFMLAINRYKVNYQNIENIDNHRCRVIVDPTEGTSDEGSQKEVLLYRFMQPDQLLGKLFSYSDKWSDAVDSAVTTPQMYEKLLLERTKA